MPDLPCVNHNPVAYIAVDPEAVSDERREDMPGKRIV